MILSSRLETRFCKSLGEPAVLVGLILLFPLIWLRRKMGKASNKEERALQWVIAIFAVISGILTALLWMGINPTFFMHYKTDFENGLIAALSVFSFLIIVYLLHRNWGWLIVHLKKPAETRINNRYRDRLLKEVMFELETEVKTKNIVLAEREKEEVLRIFSGRVITDIMSRQASPTYTACHPRYFAYTEGMELCNVVFTTTEESAETLAKKMTELANNRKYRRRWYRFSSLFRQGAPLH